MALSDYFRPDLFRPRNLVPGFVAFIIVAGAWFVIDQMQTDEPPPVIEQAATGSNEAPAPQPLPEAEEIPPTVYPTVLVASREIGRGVLLKTTMVEWREEWQQPIDLSLAVIKDAVPISSVLGAVTRRAIGADEPITWENLVISGMPGFVTAVLAPGHRAITVSVDAATTRAQIIYPGDRVDVILVHSPGSGGVPREMGGSDGPASQVIVRDVRVLAVGSATIEMDRYRVASIVSGGLLQRPEPPSGETYTLEVSMPDAERLALAGVTGQLTLVVRPVSAVSVENIAAAGPGASGWHKTPVPVRFGEVMYGMGPDEAEVEPARPDSKIRIIRGRGRSGEQTLELERRDAAGEAADLLAEALSGD